ncbi:phage tail protein [Peptoniphilus asaccharolyticus]
MATELGKAYVQIIPSAQGISGKISSLLKGESKSAGESSGQTLGTSLVSKLKGVIAGAAIGKAIGASLKEGANLQQSLGGIETLFKGHADKVKQYAQESYKTVGVSANEYMENVTSFSASLLQSLGGDTSKAADIANMAMVDMGDNANKMGTNMGLIQNAYQGFSKQNYTMLDNLKLGYGGTRSEMLRLLADAEKLTGIKYDINNLSDVYEAIHVIQTELGITGTTAKEAMETLTGSFNSMKSAFKNVLGSLAIGENVKESFSALAETISTFVFDNLIPMIGNIFKSLPEGVEGFFGKLGEILPQKAKSIMDSVGVSFSSNATMTQAFSKIKESFSGVLDSLKTAFSQLPALFQTVGSAIQPIIETIVEAFSNLDFSGFQSLAEAIVPAITSAFQNFISIVSPAVKTVAEAFTNLWNSAQPLVTIIAGALQPAFQVLSSFLGGVVKGALLGISTTMNLIATAIKILTPIINILVEAFKAISPALSTIAEWVGTVIGYFGNLGASGTSLKELMSSAWTNINQAIATAKTVITKSVEGIKAVFIGFKTSGDTLKAGISTAWNGIKTAITTVVSVIKNLINQAKTFFTSLKTSGDGLKTGLTTAWNGIKTVVTNSVTTIKNLIQSMKSAFDSLRNIDLFSAGKAIMDGFLKGIDAVWNIIKEKVGGMGGWIKAHKGPISYDKKLLIPAGKAIMEGLNNGILTGFKDVKSTVSSIAPRLNLMDKIAEDTSMGFQKSLAFNMKSNGFKADDLKDVASEDKPQVIYLSMGGKVFKAFVDSITTEQDQQTELELAY